ncbi:MAG: phosphatase PAP2 family protein [Acidimicrobiales bacterium]|nr:phosphatase PAP2 family protein [Acidimicrobiales bacterium]
MTAPDLGLDAVAADDAAPDEPLPPRNLLDAELERLTEAHPELPLPHHSFEPPHRRSAVHRFDDAVDRAFDRIRGTEPADRVLYALTELGDFGLIWMLIGFTKGLRSDADADAAFRLAVALGAESTLLNGVVKSQFKRERPVVQETRPYRIRIPLTTSFPSGHASTAMVASLLMTADPRTKAKPLYFVLAGLIAASRVHVRIHHASDVVGGVVVGTTLGLIARKVWPLRRRS